MNKGNINCRISHFTGKSVEGGKWHHHKLRWQDELSHKHEWHLGSVQHVNLFGSDRKEGMSWSNASQGDIVMLQDMAGVDISN